MEMADLAPKPSQSQEVVIFMPSQMCRTADEALLALDELEKRNCPITGVEGFSLVDGGRMPIEDEILDLSHTSERSPSETWRLARAFVEDANSRASTERPVALEIFFLSGESS